MFDNIVGNDKNKKILSDITEPSHAYMFIGIDGIGKRLFAKEFAYKWLCTSKEKPCGECKSCIQFKGNNNLDFNIIEPEKGSIKVEQIREMIKKVYELPLSSNKKIYIINDADKMTTSAQNALLKVLEEPPLYIMIILIGSNEQLFLNTIKSRCIKINFLDLTNSEIKEYMKKNGFQTNDKFLELYEGSIGRIKLIEGMEEDYIAIEESIRNIKRISKIDFVKKIGSVINKGNIEEMLNYLNILLFKLGKCDTIYLEAIDFVNLATKQSNFNCNVEMLVDNMALNIYDIINR